ncbi:MAG TPA: oligosaccharide flippase family protein [Thermomicrobiaceae bacterium]|nr:oligosaccharide flippase family protein [Thermomicrobiaceae bacterium]
MRPYGLLEREAGSRARAWLSSDSLPVQALAAVIAGLALGSYIVLASGLHSRFAPMLTVALLGALVGAIVGDVRRLLLAVVLLGIPFRIETHLDYHLAEAQLGAIGGLGLSATTACLALLYALWLGELLLRRTENRPNPRSALPLFVYVGFAGLSLLAATERSLSVFELFMLLQTLLLFIYLVSTVRTRADVEFVVGVLLAGVLLESIVILATFALHHDLHFLGIKTRTDSSINGKVVSPRYGGTIGGPNGAAAYFELLLVPALALAWRGRSKLWRLLGCSACGLGLLSLLLTQSRGGMLALAVSLAVFTAIAVRRGWLSPVIPITGVIGAAVLLLTVHGALPARFFDSEGAQAADGRWPLLKLALRVIRDHPLFGVGANNFAVILKQYATPDLSADWLYTVHNKYLLVWAEDGAVAFAGFILFLLASLRRGLRASRIQDPTMAIIAAALLASLVGHMVHMALDIFNDRTLVEELWVIAALLTALVSLPAMDEPQPPPLPVPVPRRPRVRAARPLLRPLGVPLAGVSPSHRSGQTREVGPTAIAPAVISIGGSPLPPSPTRELSRPTPLLILREGNKSDAANKEARPEHSWRVIAHNAGAMLASDAVNRAATFVLYTLVARRLGAEQFGQLSLALTLFYTFQILATAGLKSLVMREVARRREQAGVALVNASAVVLATSLLSIAAASVFVRLMGYAPNTAQVIVLLSLGLVPYALSAICEAVLQGVERMGLIAVANVPMNLLKIALAFAVITRGGGLEPLALVLLATQTLSLLLEWGFVARVVVRPRFTLDLGLCRRLLHATLTFLGIDGVIAISSSLNVVLLSHYRSESDVGFYNAATQLLVPVSLVLQSLVVGVVPAMCRRFGLAGGELRGLAAPVIEVLLALALPMAAGLYLLAEPAVRVLYGPDRLSPAATALQILCWGLIASALTSVLGQVLVASLRERVALRIVAVDLAVSIVAGGLLIPAFGFVGAALAALLVRVVDLILHYRPIASEFPLGLLARAAWKPALASLAMALAIQLGRPGSLPVTLLAAAAVYLVGLAGLTVAESGSPARARLRYQTVWKG